MIEQQNQCQTNRENGRRDDIASINVVTMMVQLAREINYKSEQLFLAIIGIGL